MPTDWVEGTCGRNIQLLQMCHDFSSVRSIPMFEKVNSLPCSERQTAILDRNVQADRQHRRLDMGRHIVRTFVCVGQVGHVRVGGGRHEAREKVLQIGLNFGVGVFLNEERGGCVLDEQREEAVGFRPVADLPGEFIKTGAGGLDFERRVH